MTYIFDHIFKTAGTTFHSAYLPAAFRSEERFVVRGYLTANAEDLKSLAELAPEEKQKLKMIAGHHTGWLRPSFPHAKYFTLIRNPIDRAISAYLHAKYFQDADSLIGKHMREKNIGLSDFVAENFFSKIVEKHIRDQGISVPGMMENDMFARKYANFVSLHNRQAETLLGPVASSVELSDSDSIREVIRSRFLVIGYSEKFELFLFFLHRSEGFPLVLFNNFLVRKERENFRPSIGDIDTIKKLNVVDCRLYEIVKADFGRRIAEIWDDECDRLFMSYLAALEEFRTRTGGDPHRRQLFTY